uniref:Uncharacterized protein n=1 Tax=Ignisphaera aggregans TaxID=334771 RepID=A0A7J3Z6S2_9CREN
MWALRPLGVREIRGFAERRIGKPDCRESSRGLRGLPTFIASAQGGSPQKPLGGSLTRGII